jgi:recombinational DNA repair protein (RecF pathway)
MKLYVCWETPSMLRKRQFPCARAYRALKDAGYQPNVTRCYGSGALRLPWILNQTPGRRAVKRLTGRIIVPLLVTDTGETVQECKNIVAWAEAHPAPAKVTMAA